MERWYAIHVRPCCERIVEWALTAQSLESFYPTWIQERADGAKVKRPLFPGYVFAQFDRLDRDRVLRIPQVCKILGNSLGPMYIPDDEIEAVRLMVNSTLPVMPDVLTAGDQVRVRSGPLAGVIGVVCYAKDCTRIVVNIPMMGQAVSAQIDRNALELVLPEPVRLDRAA